MSEERGYSTEDLEKGRIAPPRKKDQPNHSHTRPYVEPKISLQDALFFAFSHFYHLDRSNAAFHCGTVRFSPITFRLAEHLWQQFTNLHTNAELYEVVLNMGEYEEDKGR